MSAAPNILVAMSDSGQALIARARAAGTQRICCLPPPRINGTIDCCRTNSCASSSSETHHTSTRTHRRHFSIVLPSIPGRILCNAELGDKLGLLSWRKKSKLPLDLLMLREEETTRDKAIVALARGQIQMKLQDNGGEQQQTVLSETESADAWPRAGREERTRDIDATIPVMFACLNLSLDRHNRDFWAEQGRRLCEKVAGQYFSAGGTTTSGQERLQANRVSVADCDASSVRKKGVMLLCHHNVEASVGNVGCETTSSGTNEENAVASSSATSGIISRKLLETGAHRILTTVQSCTFRKSVFSAFLPDSWVLSSSRRRRTTAGAGCDADEPTGAPDEAGDGSELEDDADRLSIFRENVNQVLPAPRGAAEHAENRQMDLPTCYFSTAEDNHSTLGVEVVGRLPFGQLVLVPRSRRRGSNSAAETTTASATTSKLSLGQQLYKAVNLALYTERNCFSARVLFDERDPVLREAQQLLQAAPIPRAQSEKIAITAVPFGLTVAEEKALLATPLSIPAEVLRFDTRKVQFL
ncbi:unnamed protein product [Amoebophrya sp. A120]|nr:unnamed protein product [Amoebophrya sp. A120]|eukprot:GSA120T00015660001.1